MVMRILGVVAAIAVTAAVAASAYVLSRPPQAAQPAVAGAGASAEPVVPTTPEAAPSPRRTASAPPPVAATAPAPAPKPAAEPALPAPGAAEQRVSARLQRLMQRSAIRDRVGLAVVDHQGRTVYDHQSSTPVLPASTQKLAVAGAALAAFGPGHRYTTTVTTTAAPDAKGVVRGDLILVGGGDSALAQPAFGRIRPERPRTGMERLVDQVRQQGVRRVTGRILADPSFLAEEPVAAGWPSRYFKHLDATRVAGLTVDGGRRLYGAGNLQAEAAEDPALQAAVVFRRMLEEHKVKVGGPARRAPRSRPSAQVLATVESPPLGTMLRYMVQRSDNHLADTIFRTIGQAKGDSTWIGAAAATAEVLAPLQLDWDGVVLADGSGLSRANRVSPGFLAQLQARMMQSNLREQWVPLLALSGSSGTLRSRFTGTVAERRVYGKTGSLRDVSALVGTVAGTEGRQLHFAIVGNQLDSTYRMREVTDATVLAMAEEIQDCRRVPRPPKGKGKNRTPRAPKLVCG